MTNAGTELHELDTCWEAKNIKLFWVCFHFHFCTHMIPSYVSEWQVLSYYLNCPVKIWTSLPKSANSLSQPLCCYLSQQPLPSQLKMFQACKQCAAVCHPPDVSNTHHHPRSSPADHNPLLCYQVQQTIEFLASSHILWNSLFTKHPIIQHYKEWATENTRVIWKWSKREKLSKPYDLQL